MSTRLPHYDVVSVGSAVRDVMFYTSDAELVKNPKKDPTKLKFIGFEYGAKIHSTHVVQSLGGGAANTAVGMSRLGLRNAALVSVGQDANGDSILGALSEAGVDTGLVQVQKKSATGFSFLVVETKTHEHVAFADYGANMQLTLTPRLMKSFTTDWFYVSSVSGSNWFEIMERLVKTGSKIAWNPGAIQLASSARKLRAILSGVEVLIVNKDEALELAIKLGMKTTASSKLPSAKELAMYIQSKGPAHAMVTNGRKGTHVYNGSTIHFAKPDPDKPVDTTGAGDCFGSSFITGLIRYNYDYDKALQLAVVNSTALVAYTGAQTGLLRWAKANRAVKARI